MTCYKSAILLPTIKIKKIKISDVIVQTGYCTLFVFCLHNKPAESLQNKVNFYYSIKQDDEWIMQHEISNYLSN